MHPRLLTVLASCWVLAGCGASTPVMDGEASGGGGGDATPTQPSTGDPDAPRPPTVAPTAAPPPEPTPVTTPPVDGVLSAIPSAERYALVGEEVVLDASASTGAVSYQWFFGNGESTLQGSEPLARVTYAEAGRYQVVLRVFDERGNQQSAGVTVSVTPPSIEFGSYSRSLARLPDGEEVVAVSADADQLIVLAPSAPGEWQVARRIDTCRQPRTVTAWQGLLATACQGADQVGLYPIAGGAGSELSLPYGAGPFGVATDEDRLFVTEQGSGRVTLISLQAGTAVINASIDAIPDARAIAALPDGRLAVTRWRSPDEQGELVLLDPDTGASNLIALAFDPQIASDAGIGGIPSYLAELAVSPTGLEAFIPSLMANHTEGLLTSGRALTFETTVRAALSRVDLTTGAEDFLSRFQFDDRGLAGAVAFSRRGDFAYVVMPANRSVVVLDLLTGVEAGVFNDAGFAPDGAVVVGDDQYLLVNSALSREVVVYDLATLSPAPIQRVPLLLSEPLEPEVLLGKQLFNDAADTRLARSGYIACAHCHLDGDSDRRVWDFTDRGEGLRNTVSLLGRAGAGDGPIHWSGNFDEIHDFEHDIRNGFGGTGLMDDADFNTGTRNTTLGDPKAGISADLDALALYVSSLATELRSPFRNPDGSLSDAAARGKTSFESAELGCSVCHAGARLTDSQFLSPGEPLLHDVGTLGPGSGQRLAAPLLGIDTPTLHGLWSSAPYLHDGSALTLGEVLTDRNASELHGTTSQLSAPELDDLVAYLLSQDGTSE